MKPLRIGLPSGSLQEATLELFRRAGFSIAANSAVLVPVFNSPTDQPTLELLRPFFPDRKVVGIDCSALVGGLGAIHCITLPKRLFRPSIA